MYRILLSGSFLLLTMNGVCLAESTLLVSHHDTVVVEKNLTLAQLVNATFEKHPDASWLPALEEEVKALYKRADSWVAGASQASVRYQEATSGTLHYVDAGVQVPLWNVGQRDAEFNVGVQANLSADSLAAATKLRIAGLVRAALWDMALQKSRYEQAKVELDSFNLLFTKIKRRVALGDLPRMDAVLLQTEVLQKRSALTQAEAELMHSRKRYMSITQSQKMPANYQEKLVALKEIEQSHPALVALSRQIERKQAELDAQKLVGSGQSNIAIGINSDRPSRQDPRSNNSESFNIGVNIPFGGEAHLSPHLAAINVELNKLMAERAQLYRDLEQAHHEAEHNLEVNRAEMKIADELKQAAEQHLKMTQLSYDVGEINLLDLIKVQARTQQAILNAKEREIMLQRDYALYNQAVGVLP
jgi:cobalt-zinc-cadmium efflux system outer membrane protein